MKMTKGLKDSGERLEEHQVLARIIIEMMGTPKEHITSTLRNYVKRMKEDEDLEIIKEFYAEPELKEEHKVYAIYTELEIWFKDMEKLIGYCIDAMPSSVEILEPETVKFPASELAGILNDMQSKLHRIDMKMKNYNAEQTAVVDRFKTVLDNFVVYCIKNGNLTADEISAIIGIEKDKTILWLDQLVQKKVIIKKDDFYSIKQ